MNERLIKVQGQGSASATPDHVALSFQIRAEHEEYAETIRLLDQKLQAVREQLAAAKVPKKDLKTFRFDVSIRYVTRNKEQVFAGYQAQHSLRLELPWNKNHLNLVLERLSEISEGVEFSIGFFIEDKASLQKMALERAVGRARDNAQVIAEAADVTLGDIVHIEYGWTEVHFESDLRYEVASCQASAEMNPVDVDHSENVTVSWSIVPTEK